MTSDGRSPLSTRGQEVPPQARPPRLLLVEDDPDQAGTLSDLLTEEGYRPEAVSTGAEALASLAVSDFDLCIVDWMLPDFLGHHLIDRMKLQQPSTRCILLTGMPQSGSAELAVNHGADGYAVKPVDLPFLLTLIESVLLRRRLNQENERLEGAIQTLRAFRQEICLPLEGLLHHVESVVRGVHHDPTLSRNAAQLQVAGDLFLRTLDRLDGMNHYQTKETSAGPMLDIPAKPRSAYLRM
jgi:DNA-binding response OmpR family regulator